MFRNEYFQNYVHILLNQKLFDRAEKTLLREIWYLKDHKMDSKHFQKDMHNWKLDLGIVYLITEEIAKATRLATLNEILNVEKVNDFQDSDFCMIDPEFQMSDQSGKLNLLFAFWEEKNQEKWDAFFKSSKTYSIKPSVMVKRAREYKFAIPSEVPEEIEDIEEAKEKLEDMVL